MQLTMIFIKLAIRSTHGHVAGLAVLHTPALRLVGVLVHDALTAPAAVLLLTGGVQTILPVQHCEEHKRAA